MLWWLWELSLVLLFSSMIVVNSVQLYNLIRNDWPEKALNLLASKRKSLSMVNTSQSLGQMPYLEKDSDALMCLAMLGLGSGLVCVCSIIPEIWGNWWYLMCFRFHFLAFYHFWPSCYGLSGHVGNSWAPQKGGLCLVERPWSLWACRYASSS